MTNHNPNHYLVGDPLSNTLGSQMTMKKLDKTASYKVKSSDTERECLFISSYCEAVAYNLYGGLIEKHALIMPKRGNEPTKIVSLGLGLVVVGFRL